ncbi:MAG: hypothetical protein R2744_03465 [Bacteroidales bacterium]
MDIAKDIQVAIDELEAPGVSVKISGTIEDQMESFADLGLLMVLSLGAGIPGNGISA